MNMSKEEISLFYFETLHEDITQGLKFFVKRKKLVGDFFKDFFFVFIVLLHDCE